MNLKQTENEQTIQNITSMAIGKLCCLKKGNVCFAQNISKKETQCKTLFKHAVANLAYWNPTLLDVQHQGANKQVSV